MIRVAFRYGDRRILSRLICAFRGGDVSHCEAVHQWAGSVHWCVSASWVDGGVRAKVLALDASKWRVYELPGNPETVRRWLDAHNGEGYDWLGLVGFFVRRIRGSTERRLCSEAVAEMLGLPDPWRYDPAILESLCAAYGRRVSDEELAGDGPNGGGA